MVSDRREWFAAKRYGYGTGLPISWQGWLLFVGFLAIVIVAGLLLAPRSMIAYLALVIPLTIGFVLVARSSTRGGWRWRWGDPD